MIDDRHTFEFDLDGFVVIPGALGRDDVARMNRIIDASPAARVPHKFHFLELDRAFLDLLTHPTVTAICSRWIDPAYRFDHAWGVQHFAGETNQRESLHGGPWAEQGYFQYHWHAGRPRCVSLLFGFALEPQRAGDGGLIVVPGSHKSNLGLAGGEVLDRFLAGDHHAARWIVQPELAAGDLVVLTEATMHGTDAWRARDRRRRVLYYQFALGCAGWLPHDDPGLDRARQSARDDTERRLMRPPYVSAISGNRQAFRAPTLPGSHAMVELERAGASVGRAIAARIAGLGAKVMRWRASP